MSQASPARGLFHWRLSATGIALLYGLLGVLWILFSDALAAALVPDPEALTRVQTIKGWFYIVVTAGLLYGLIRRREEALRRTQATLRESEERFRTLMEQSPVSIQILTPAGQTLLVNRAWERLWGVTLADLAGYNVLEDEQLRSLGLMPYIERGFAGETTALPLAEYDAGQTLGSGRKRWVQGVVYPVEDEGGRVRNVILMHEDVSERKQAEDERELLLRELEDLAQMAERRAAELQSVLDNMVDGVFVCDAEGRVTLTNKAGARLLGLTGEEGSPRAPRPNGKPIGPEEWALSRTLAGKTVLNAARVIRGVSPGRDIYMRINATPIRDAQGRIVGAVAVGRDVTELRELELLKDQFLAVAAHELKTPVAIMKGYSQALLRGVEEASPRRRKMLEAVDRGADRIEGVVNDLLDIAKLQEGQLELALGRIDLAELVEEVVDRLDLGAPRHQVRLRSAQPAVVQGDRDRLEQVLANLLDNAIRYSPEGGDVDVAVAVRGREAVVAVADHGVGIPAEKQGRIFERFYRAHTDTPYDYGGMGVGLYISREIVKRHGGRVWFESEEGKGSTFSFSLPLAGQPQAT